MSAAARTAILISGFYGFGNVGDEAVLAGMVQSLRARLGAALPLIVLSADPRSTAAAYQVDAVHRTDLRAILHAMRRSRLFLSGGGSLIQDVTSARSAVYYLGLLRLAQIAGLRTMVYAAGLGPLRRPLIRRLTRSVLDRADGVTVRDLDSAALARAVGISHEPVLTADPAVVLTPGGDGRVAVRGGSVGPDVPLIGAVVRPWNDDRFVDSLGAALTQVAQRRQAGVIVLPFHSTLDLAVSRRLAEACGGTLVDRALRPAEMLTLIAQVQVLVGLRLHALLFAAMSGVPPVGLAYDPKVAALFQDLEIEAPPPLEADVATLAAAIDGAWVRREPLRPALLAATARLRTRAEVAAEHAERLYGAV